MFDYDSNVNRIISKVLRMVTMEDHIIMSRQKAANCGRLFVITAITMLPVLTHGCLNAYLTVALPKYLQSNPTGIVLDFLQVSWIGGFK